ncbi:MAG: PIN domain-containing protein [Nitrospirae bacterium]|nr:PIN domain-containing protein [Nitrospirota bacterium]
MRVVFDTNIFITALVIPGSQAEKAVLGILDGADTLLISKPILDKLLSTLARGEGF